MKNLFIVNTEYHFLLSMQIIRMLYGGDSAENKIFILKTQSRFNSTREGKVSNITVEEMPNPISYAAIHEIIQTGYSNYFYFHNFNIVLRWISWQLKKRGTTICYVQDGMAAYLIYRQNMFEKLLVIMRESVKDWMILRKRGLKPNKPFISNGFVYGNNWAIDKLFLTNPELYTGIKKKDKRPLVRINPFDKETFDLLKTFMNYPEFSQKANTILHINQPLRNEHSMDLEVRFLKAVREKYSKWPFYIKLHPNICGIHRKRYGEIENVRIIDTNVPAEIYMSEMKDSLFISVSSTSFFHHVLGNSYYYFHPIFKGWNDRCIDTKQKPCLDHVKVVESAHEIS